MVFVELSVLNSTKNKFFAPFAPSRFMPFPV
jgi:hypothetical protein